MQELTLALASLFQRRMGKPQTGCTCTAITPLVSDLLPLITIGLNEAYLPADLRTAGAGHAYLIPTIWCIDCTAITGCVYCTSIIRRIHCTT